MYAEQGSGSAVVGVTVALTESAVGRSVADDSVMEEVTIIEDPTIRVSVVWVSVGSVCDSVAADVSCAGGVVCVDGSVVEVCVVGGSVGDVRVAITVGVWQSVPEKPSGQIQPSSPVLSSR